MRPTNEFHIGYKTTAANITTKQSSKQMLKGSSETVSTSHAPEHPEFTYLASTWKTKILSLGELSHMVNCVLRHTTSEYDPAEHNLKDTDCSALSCI